MGLDWLAGNKARPGHEEEFLALVRQVVEGDAGDVDGDRFRAISTPSFACLGAPVVGQDVAADRWVLQKLRGSDDPNEEPTPRTDEERSALQQAAGYHVLQLAPQCDGLPVYSNAPLMPDRLELTSFRGQFLQDVTDVVGEELVQQAWNRMTPDGLAEYGRTLISLARDYAQAHDCAHLEHERGAPEGEGPSSLAHITFAAGKWCVFWGQRGHWLDVWF
ncbi:MAG: hypothetical protein KTR31_03530 [Myxococcales bacterium]|nr:hypothetical protein [Myxococcales bacterium]